MTSLLSLAVFAQDVLDRKMAADDAVVAGLLFSEIGQDGRECLVELAAAGQSDQGLPGVAEHVLHGLLLGLGIEIPEGDAGMPFDRRQHLRVDGFDTWRGRNWDRDLLRMRKPLG